MRVLLTLSALVAVTTAFSCLSCRRFGADWEIVKNGALEKVDNCAETSIECKEEKCYSIRYTNASTGQQGEVRDCLGKSMFGYWSIKQIKKQLVGKGADSASVKDGYTCATENCNDKQDLKPVVTVTENCVNQTLVEGDDGYVVDTETVVLVCSNETTTVMATQPPISSRSTGDFVSAILLALTWGMLMFNKH